MLRLGWPLVISSVNGQREDGDTLRKRIKEEQNYFFTLKNRFMR